MKRICNLDRHGRRRRLVGGVVLLLPGVGCLLTWGVTNQIGFFFAGIGLSVGGLFMIIEGVIGWCALRALGIKTKL